jgi:serine/threonine protein kinase
MDSIFRIEYSDFLVKHNVNKLRFPNDPNEYDFSIEDFHNILRPFSHIAQNVLHKSSGNKMAVKRIEIPTTRKEGITLYDEVNLKNNLREIELCKLMSKSPNVVDFYGFGLCGDYLYICMEVMDSKLSDVIHLMHITHKDFSNEFFAFTTISIIEALIEFKKAGVTHGHIRPSNILINRNGQIKLTQCTNQVNIMNLLSDGFHECTYASLEKIRGEEYDERADIWSLGITLLEFILGYHPKSKGDTRNILRFMSPMSYSADNTRHWIENFSWDEIEKKEKFQNHFNDYFRKTFVKSFLKKCLEVDVKNRPNLMQIQELDLYKVFASKNLDERRSEIASSYNKYEVYISLGKI